MCGIVYSQSFTGRNVTGQIKKRYKAQRSRGIDGFGFFLPQLNRLTHNTREGRILRELVRLPQTEVLFHHRWPTSTANVRNACHPFSTRGLKHNYVLVHNGVIVNDTELMVKHYKQGLRYKSMMADGSFNDSEALLYDVALYLEGKQKTLLARGSTAFILVELDQAGQAIKLHFGRNYGSPLKMVFNQQELTLASEGRGTDILPDTLYTFDYATGKMTNIALTIPTYYIPISSYSDSGYNYDDKDWYSWPKSKVHTDGNSSGSYWLDGNHYFNDGEICHYSGYACPMFGLDDRDDDDTPANIQLIAPDDTVKDYADDLIVQFDGNLDDAVEYVEADQKDTLAEIERLTKLAREADTTNNYDRAEDLKLELADVYRVDVVNAKVHALLISRQAEDKQAIGFKQPQKGKRS